MILKQADKCSRITFTRSRHLNIHQCVINDDRSYDVNHIKDISVLFLPIHLFLNILNLFVIKLPDF